MSLNAIEQKIQIVKNLIGNILDEVQNGNFGYILATGYARIRILKTVIANKTDGNGYRILSRIAFYAIRDIRDKQLRLDAYIKLEEKGITYRCNYSSSKHQYEY